MSLSLRTPAISNSGISAQLIRLLPPLGCPGDPVWVPTNEVQRWEQLGFYRALVPAADLELSWNPIGSESGGVIPVELLLNARLMPPNAVTVDWGDGTAETLPWPSGGDGNARLRHGYASRTDYAIHAELTGSGASASLLVSLAGCLIWKPVITPSPGDVGSAGGSRWFNGDGPPATVAGADPGDYYLDGISGAFYVLES